jgi:hypothetical protein
VGGQGALIVAQPGNGTVGKVPVDLDLLRGGHWYSVEQGNFPATYAGKYQRLVNQGPLRQPNGRSSYNGITQVRLGDTRS